jgi:hypothetical protein
MTVRTVAVLVQLIHKLGWSNLSLATLQWLMYISFVTAKEFAESLRIALREYPGDAMLEQMAAGELCATNLNFRYWKNSDGVVTKGDHWEFLKYYLDIWADRPPFSVVQAGNSYTETVELLSPKVRAMTIFSRERELPGIFTAILTAPAWENHDLPIHLAAFRYYLQRHIELDSQAGGHAELVSHQPVTEAVVPFYEARLRLYTSAIPDLLK